MRSSKRKVTIGGARPTPLEHLDRDVSRLRFAMQRSHVFAFICGGFFAVFLLTLVTALRSPGAVLSPGPIHFLTRSLPSVARAAPEPPAGCTATLEHLANSYETDNSLMTRYPELFSMLCEPVRMQLKNVLELRVAANQSLHMWSEYFCDATITGFDIILTSKVEETLRRYKNIRTFETDVLEDPGAWREASLEVGSIDLVIDDAGMHSPDDAGMHPPELQEVLLNASWPYVKPGGLYVIQDFDGWNGLIDVEGNRERLTAATRAILEASHIVFVDSKVLVIRCFPPTIRNCKSPCPNIQISLPQHFQPPNFALEDAYRL